MKLFLVCHKTDFEGYDEEHSLELLVRCEDADRAVELWREHFRSYYDHDEDAFNQLADMVPDQVFLIPDDVTGALAWHKTVKEVRTRYHAIEDAKQALGVDV